MDQLWGKVAIITGGASGIGRALSQELARRGAVVVIADIDSRGAECLAERVMTAGGEASWAAVDVTKPDEVQQLVHAALQREGRIDFMFNVAGLGPSGGFQGVSVCAWQKTSDINLNGVVYGCAAVYPEMIRQGFGHIVNTASLAGLIPAPTMAVYSATKYAVVGFSTSLRAEARAFGVNVTVVCPAWVSTNIRPTTRAILGAESVHPLQDQLTDRVSPEECAKGVIQGVLRNRAIVVLPRYAGLAWRLYRLFPSLWDELISPWIARKAWRLAAGASVLSR
jgi:short-subunit dehydrogenase